MPNSQHRRNGYGRFFWKPACTKHLRTKYMAGVVPDCIRRNLPAVINVDRQSAAATAECCSSVAIHEVDSERSSTKWDPNENTDQKLSQRTQHRCEPQR